MIYERIKELREDHDLTQQNIAKFLHIAQNTYCNYENGVREIPVPILIRLSRYYAVNLEFLLGLTDQPDPLPPSRRFPPCQFETVNHHGKPKQNPDG